jgi:DeoR family transcriptional regulator of aga operon
VELAFNSRALQCSAEKRLIGARAARQILPGQTIFLGEGTTTAQFAQFVPPHPNLLIITAALSHASLLCSRGINVIVAGGKLDPNELSMTGPLAESSICQFYVDVCVLGAAGVDPAIGITESDHEVAHLHRLMMERSRHVLLLADWSKLGYCAPAIVAPVSSVSTLVTDGGAPEAILSALASANVQVTLVERQAAAG